MNDHIRFFEGAIIATTAGMLGWYAIGWGVCWAFVGVW